MLRTVTKPIVWARISSTSTSTSTSTLQDKLKSLVKYVDLENGLRKLFANTASTN